MHFVYEAEELHFLAITTPKDVLQQWRSYPLKSGRWCAHSAELFDFTSLAALHCDVSERFRLLDGPANTRGLQERKDVSIPSCGDRIMPTLYLS